MSAGPMWGCPYHGLVQGAQITLDNGKVLPYGPSVSELTAVTPWQVGSLQLVAHPNAPEDKRTDEERAADTERGWDWKRTALVSGAGVIHGQRLDHEKWLYIDPAGAVWQARASVTIGIAAVLELQRFGLLAGKPETYYVTMKMPDLGQVTPDLGETVGGAQVVYYHANKTGSAAVLMVGAYQLTYDRLSGQRFVSDDSGAYGMSPIGWLEVEISGPGRKATATLKVLKTRREALGTAITQEQADGPRSLTYQSGFMVHDEKKDTRVDYPTCSGSLEIATSVDWVYGPGVQNGASANVDMPGPNVVILTGTHRKDITGQVLGYYYREDGSRAEVTLNTQYSASYDIQPPKFQFLSSLVRRTTNTGASGDRCLTSYEAPSLGRWTVNRVASITESLTMELCVDGARVSGVSYSGSNTATDNNTATLLDNGNLELTHQSEHVSAYTNGPNFKESLTRTGEMGFTELQPQMSYAVAADDAERLIPRLHIFGAEHIAWRFSCHLYGLVDAREGVLSTRDVISPNGKTNATATLTPPRRTSYNAPLGKIYGSWNPHTGAARLSLAPIYWA